MPCLDGWMVLDGGQRLRVECDFGSGWVNVTTYLRGLSIERGRRGPNDRFDAGTCQVEFDNHDARFSTYSAVYGASRPVKTGNRLRVLARSGSYQRAIFTGWVDAWEERGDTAADLDAMTATCFDGWERLARAGFSTVTTPVGVGERGDQRVNRLLDAAGWTGGRAIQTAAVTMQGTTFDGGLLDELHDVALSESGEVLVDGTGTVRFLSKATITGARPAVATLSNDCATGLPFVSIDMRSSSDGVINTAYIAARDTATQTAVNDPSVARFGARVFTATDLLHETEAQSAAAASHIVAVQAAADFAVTAVDVYPATGKSRAERDALWRLIAATELVDRLNVIFVPEHASARASWLAPIDGLRLDATPTETSITYRLGPIGQISAPEVIAPPYDLHEISVSATTIVWVWTNGAVYDEILVRIDGPGYRNYPWQSLPGGTTTWTLGLGASEEQYTLCVKGRAGLVETDEVCDDATTGKKLAGPSDEGCFDIPFPDDVLHCGFHYVVYFVNEEGDRTIVIEGEVPADAYGTCWRPVYAYVPGTIYQLCLTQVCDGVPQDEQCSDVWTEPPEWGAFPCVYPELLAGNPMAQIEICAAQSKVADITTVVRAALTKGPVWGEIGYGPMGAGGGGPADVVVADGTIGILVGPNNIAGLTRLVTRDDPNNSGTELHAGMTVAWWQKGIYAGPVETAIILTEPFNDLTNWTGSFWLIVGGGVAGTCAQTTGINQIAYTIPTPPPRAKVTLWWKVSDLAANRTIIQFRNTAESINHVTLRADVGGTLRALSPSGASLGATAAGAVVANTWYQVSIECTVSTTAGIVNAWLSGTQFCAATGVNTASGGPDTVINKVVLTGGATTNVDELVLEGVGIVSDGGAYDIYNMDDVWTITEATLGGALAFAIQAKKYDGITDTYLFEGLGAPGDVDWHHYAVGYGWDAEPGAEPDTHIAAVWVDGTRQLQLLEPLWLLADHGTSLTLSGAPGLRYAQWTTWDHVLTDAEIVTIMGPGTPIGTWGEYVARGHPLYYVPAVDGSGVPAIDTIPLGSAVLAGTGTVGPFGEPVTPTNVNLGSSPLGALMVAEWSANGDRTYQLIGKPPSTGFEWTFMAYYGMELNEYMIRNVDGDLELVAVFPPEGEAFAPGVSIGPQWKLMHLVVHEDTFDFYIGLQKWTFDIALVGMANGGLDAGPWYFEFGPFPGGLTHVAIYNREFTDAQVSEAVTTYEDLT